MKNKKSIVLIVVLLLAVLITYLDSITPVNINLNYKYLIEYNDGIIPGSTYYIYVFKDYEVIVDKRQYCSTPECIDNDTPYTSKVYEVEISLKNKDKLKKYLNRMFKNEETRKVVLHDYDVLDNDRNIINSIIFNNPKYFEYYKD